MKNRSTSHLVLTGLFAVLVLAASNSIVRACPDTTTWIGGAGNWFAGANWPNGCVPTELVDASINNGGQAQILGDHAMAKSLILGDNQGQAGLVTVSGASSFLELGTSPCRGSIYIGNRGSGTLTIGNGGFVKTRYAYVAAAANVSRPPSNGVVTVKGSGSILIVYDSQNQPGCLGAGLFIGGTADSDGFGGTATLSIVDGASVEVHNHAGGDSVTVGRSGTLTGNARLSLIGAAPSPQIVRVFGTLAPAEGELTIAGDLDLQPEANTVCHVTPQSQDHIHVSQDFGGGHAQLGGRLTVVITGTFPTGAASTLVHADAGLNETKFQSVSYIYLGGGPCISPGIEYDANNVTLRLQSCDLAEEP